MARETYEPEHYARELLSLLNLTRIQNLGDILSALKLKVVEKEFTSVDGALVRKSGKGIIAVKRSIKENGRKNFTICHEIGHYVIPKHGSIGCKSDDIESCKSGISTHEIEANRFASELLLPTEVIYPLVNKQKATIALAKDIARDFKTSLTATTLKCAKITEEKCAVVWSVNGQIKWFNRNENFSGFIRSGSLDTDSIASQLNDSHREMDACVPAETWIESDILNSAVEIWEDSIYLPAYDGVLTILTLD